MLVETSLSAMSYYTLEATIICAERGLLLLRTRDEVRMTICAYQSLYESSIAFGMRKALMAEQRRNMQNKKHKYRSYAIVLLIFRSISSADLEEARQFRINWRNIDVC